MRLGIGLGLFKSGLISAGVRIFSAFQTRVIGDGGTVEAGTCVVNAINSSALLQQASLLLIPSGYKGGKLYAEIPTNGNGDLTWTRSGTANRTNASGNIELMGANVPRLSYMYGSCPAVLAEPQRTNVVFPSEDFSTTWSPINTTVTTNQATAPDGNTTADRISITSNGGYIRRFSLTTANSSTYTASVYVKNDTISAGDTFNFYFNNNLGSPNSAQGIATININSGTVTSSSSGLGISNVSASIQSLINGWYRVNLTFTLGALAGNSNCEIGFTASTATRTFFAWGAQLEAGAYPTTYIPTTSATATRVADGATKTGISSLIGQTEGTIFLDFIFKTSDSTVGGQIGISDTSKNNRVILWNNSTNNTLALQLKASGTNAINNVSLGTFVDGTRYKIAIAYKSGDTAVYVNGTQTITNSASFTFASSLSDFILGSYETTLNNGHQFCFKTALFQTRLLNSELTTLTT